MSNIKIIAIVNHKGGVGKTTTAAAMGATLAAEGYKTLLVDLDAQANLTTSFLTEEPGVNIYHSLKSHSPLPVIPLRENLYLSPSNLDLAGIELEIGGAMSREYILKDLLEPMGEAYDIIILDCPPSLGLLTINAFVAADGLIIPMTAEPLPYKGLSKIEKFVEMARKRLNPKLELTGILFTRWERSNISTAIEQAVRERFGDVVFATKIRKNISVAEASLKGTDITTYAPSSNGAQDYKQLAAELITRIGKPGE